MTLCSHVTWLRSWLLNTQTIHRGSAQRRQYFATVISSAMLFICIAPSPTNAITGQSGCANLAAMAYGTAAPLEAIMPRRIFRSRAYQFAHDPESLVRITRSGSLGDSSQATRCGLTGLAGC